MKKYIFTVLTLFTLSSGTVYAAECDLVDTLGFHVLYATNVQKTVVTDANNAINGNSTTICTGDITSDSQAMLPTGNGAVVLSSDDADSSFQCLTESGLSSVWQAIIAQGGKKAKLICHYITNQQ